MTLQEKIQKKAEGYRQLAPVFLEGALFALENYQFISVVDSLPKQDEEVIVLCDEHNTAPSYKISFGHIVDKAVCKDYNGWNVPGVVYWFPIPNLSKE